MRIHEQFSLTGTTATELYTLSLHDALPICSSLVIRRFRASNQAAKVGRAKRGSGRRGSMPARWWSSQRLRSEEHTSELQSQSNIVCRLLLEKKNEWPASVNWRRHRSLQKNAYS